jgi:hypothetical protein
MLLKKELQSQGKYLPEGPVIMLLSIYPKEFKTYVHTKTWKWMFTAVTLLIIAKTWKQENFPEVGEWINKL